MEYEYSGSEDEDDGMNEDEGEPRYVFIHVSPFQDMINSFSLNGIFKKKQNLKSFLSCYKLLCDSFV